MEYKETITLSSLTEPSFCPGAAGILSLKEQNQDSAGVSSKFSFLLGEKATLGMMAAGWNSFLSRVSSCFSDQGALSEQLDFLS